MGTTTTTTPSTTKTSARPVVAAGAVDPPYPPDTRRLQTFGKYLSVSTGPANPAELPAAEQIQWFPQCCPGACHDTHVFKGPAVLCAPLFIRAALRPTKRLPRNSRFQEHRGPMGPWNRPRRPRGPPRRLFGPKTTKIHPKSIQNRSNSQKSSQNPPKSAKNNDIQSPGRKGQNSDIKQPVTLRIWGVLRNRDHRFEYFFALLSAS